MKIEYRDPAELRPYPNNPKAHPKEQIDAIASSIKNFGFDQPIVIDPEGFIVKGHGRRLAAVQLKMKSVPVIITEGSDQDRLNRLLDNKLTSRTWDHQMLRDDLLELQEAGLIDLSLFSADLIPDIGTTAPKGEVSSFNMLTSHQCPTCQYKW